MFTYISKDVDDKPILDHKLFLEEAATSQVSEIISSFYPNVTFSPEAEDDNELLNKFFVEMIVPHLSTFRVPEIVNRNQQSYFQALIITPTGFENEDIWITPNTVFDASRILRFDCLVLCYLKIGQHRLAADNLAAFLKTHKFLNKYEINAINSTYENALEGLQESVGFIQDTHQEIEAINLQIFHSETSPTHLQDLQVRLQSATVKLQFRQKTFDTIVQNLGFIKALLEYHEKIASINQPATSGSS